MNSGNESEGWSLLQTWKSRLASVLVEFSTANRDVFLKAHGAISLLERNRIEVCGEDFDFACDLGGSVFEDVGSALRILSVGLDPARYPESVVISLGGMHRLTLAVPPAPEEGTLQ